MRKNIIQKILFVFVLGIFMAGCAKQTEEEGRVYYLNFKPEVAGVWEEIAQIYTEETGVEVKVNTAASGNYEKILKSEMAKREVPTLFQINGPLGYEEWKEFCLDLSNTELYGHLLDKELAITTEDGVWGIPYVVEGYGIIYNDAIMRKYFSLPDKAVAISSAEDITSFDILKAVAEDMTLHTGELGIKGVFASTSMASGEDWRWQTHLMNIPIYYEFADNNVVDMDEIQFTYAEQFRNIFELYVNNSCTDRSLLGIKTVTDSMKEFALGEAAMVQNGNWAWSQVNGIEGNTVKEGDVKFLPIYSGVSGEQKQGLCIGTENYFSVNSWASEADQKATIAFVEWLFTSEKGKDYVTNRLGFIAPFDTFGDDEKPTDPLAKEVIAAMEDTEKTSVSWNFTAFPGQQFKDKFGRNLLEYINETKTWDMVVKDVKETWKAEK